MAKAKILRAPPASQRSPVQHFCFSMPKAKFCERLRRRKGPRFRVLSHERTPGPVALCFAAANARTPPLGQFSSGGANSPPADAEFGRDEKEERKTTKNR